MMLQQKLDHDTDNVDIEVYITLSLFLIWLVKQILKHCFNTRCHNDLFDV